MVREPTDEERQMWRTARARDGAAKFFGGLWDLVQEEWAWLQDDRPRRTQPGPRVCPASLVVGAGEGPVRDRLTSGAAAVRGSLSLPTDGVLWQPDDPNRDRGLLMKNEEVQVLVAGLSGDGLLFHLPDGRLGFVLHGRTRSTFEADLTTRFDRPDPDAPRPGR